ncbi:MAG TPA: HlyD family efflux transporter periplasmic adaptor subunit [Methylibium sp.]|uniref:HlyD family secretion protein n=1 Tax=Methylibium sp. TaxID=2067992 RepID=UPI002DBC2580|nr:HlyD family efflux transporter periplasmic adaptor subunit [Methylibium sp.]HEU4459494.1 HlyD family efflux transporter periplasmic adaptor subunit [Methylibium sp.]
MADLFRPEAVEAQRQVWLGEIALMRPVSLSVCVALVLFAVVGLSILLVFAHYERKARVAGVLVPDQGVIRLLPQERGTLAERRVVEGQAVRRGDTLFVLAIDRVTAGGESQAAVRESLDAQSRSLREALRREAELAATQIRAIDRQLADRRAELAQLDGEVRLQRERLQLARETLARWQSLQAESFVSAAQVQSRAEEELAVRTAVQALERQRAGQLREIGSLEAQRRELPLKSQTAAGALERDMASVERDAAEAEARQRIVVRAPSDGVMGAVLVDPGQAVTATTTLATLLPAGAQLQAHLYAPSSALGFVRPDQPVSLRYQAFPYQKFGHQTGHVLQVSRTPLQPSELATLPLANVANYATVGTEPMYRITVALDRQTIAAYGEPQPLAAGMQLDADVRLDRRRLVEWMFEPLIGLGGRLASTRAAPG